MAVDKKISQLDSGAPAQGGDEYVVARSGANYKLTLTNIAASMPPIGATTPNTGSFTSLTNSGNLTFSSTGQRITGDMSNATIANRLMVQTSTANSTTQLRAIPNGTATTASFAATNNSDPTNSSSIALTVTSTEGTINSFANGSGTALPMTFYTGGSERMRLDTSGRLSVNTSTANTNSYLTVIGNISVASPTRNQATTGQIGNWTTDDPSDNRRARITLGTTAGASSSDSYIAFSTNQYGVSDGERMRIDSSGNVGIGTASLAANTRLTVLGGRTGLVANSEPYSLYVQYGSGKGQYYIGATDSVSTPALVFSNVGGAEKFRIDHDGNVGIGTASPATKFQVYGDTNAAVQARVTNINAGASAASLFTFGNNTDAYVGYVGCVSSAGVAANGVYLGSRIASPVVISTNDAERMRITSDGEVYIAGTTDQGAYNLQCNGTGVWGAGAYVNGSDARLKDNIQSLDSGLDVVKAMRPVTFQYKPEYSKDQSVQPGFIAQELQTAMAGKPYLEGVVQEGTNHLNVAYQNIIPILVKAIQELEAKVAALEAK